jgi:ferredoxin
VGGYGVHASKLARTGVPFYLSHTILKAEGKNSVEAAVIAGVDKNFQPIDGTEKRLDVDTICIAVGLTPMSQLLAMAGCRMTEKNGTVPVLNDNNETSVKGIYTAGDVGGIDEASSAMITGNIAGERVSCALGYTDKEQCESELALLKASLDALHRGMFSPANKGRDISKTDEGYPVSQSLLTKGCLDEEELFRYPGFTEKKALRPVIECTQNIPCDPCQDACKYGCITVGENITGLPSVKSEKKCTGCGICVASCPGQAIFLVNENYDESGASITIPYEFLSLPKEGEKGTALGRNGSEVCDAEVLQCKINPAFDKTALLTIKVPKAMAAKARFFRVTEAYHD